MNKELDSKIKELRELKRMAEEIQTEIDGIQDAIKAEMTAANVDILTGSDWKATWKEVTASRIDSKALKAAFPDVAKQFTKSTVSRRFVII